MQKIKWLGAEATRIRLEPNGEKVDIEPGEVIELSDQQAKFYTDLDKLFVVVDSPEEAEAEARQEAKKKQGKQEAKKKQGKKEEDTELEEESEEASEEKTEEKTES